jgi:predicted Zn-dependent protease
MALFSDGAWEETMQRLTARDASGGLVDVVLDREAFRDLISVME